VRWLAEENEEREIMTTMKATKRLVNSVWTLEYELTSDSTIHVVRYSRKDDEGYERESELPRVRLVESEDRTVTAAVIDDVSFAVDNPGHVFSYGA
jgi:hypothetical protein